jgi:hypothetical protein
VPRSAAQCRAVPRSLAKLVIAFLFINDNKKDSIVKARVKKELHLQTMFALIG